MTSISNIPTDPALSTVAQQLGVFLQKQQQFLATAESCTGGWVGKIITDIAGSSRWYERGFITYSNQAKQDLLGVSAENLRIHGAVSEQTAHAMARGVLAHSSADVALSITGIAGPDGGSEDKPVGLIWFAWARRDGKLLTEQQIFDGNREAVRRQACWHALQGVLSLLK